MISARPLSQFTKASVVLGIVIKMVALCSLRITVLNSDQHGRTECLVSSDLSCHQYSLSVFETENKNNVWH